MGLQPNDVQQGGQHVSSVDFKRTKQMSEELEDGATTVGAIASTPPSHVAAAWAWFDRLERPRYWLAPLVGLSEPAFRILARRHGAHICSTEMIDAAGYSKSQSVPAAAAASSSLG